MRSALLTGLLFATSLIHAQVYLPDSLFGNDSRLALSPGSSDEFIEFIVQDDSMIIIGGYDYDININAYLIDMVRMDVCGRLDVTFGDSGIVRHTFSQRNTANKFLLQSDGKIISAGLQAPSNAGSQQIPYVARFNADGSPDTTFFGTGSVSLRFDNISSGAFYSIYELDGGKILAIGKSSANINGGVNGVGAMRFLPDGTLDLSYNGDGIARFSDNSFNPGTIVLGHLMSDGRIITVQQRFDPSFSAFLSAVALDSTGTIDSTFALNGIYTDSVIISARPYSVLQPDGKIIMGAQRSPAADGIELVRINPDGTPDLTYGVNGHVNINVAGVTLSGLKFLNGDSLLIMAEVSPPGEGFAMQLTPSGAVDSSFGSNGIHIFNVSGGVANHSLRDIIRISGDRYLAGGGNGDFYARRFSLQSNVPHITYVHPNLVTAPQSSHQWYLDSVLIPGATSNTFDPVAAGNYTVEITDDLGCPYMSDPFNIADASISETSLSAAEVYPNPFSDQVTVSSLTDILQLELTDATGRQILRQYVQDRTVMLPLKNLRQGIYFITIDTMQGRSIHKLIRQ